MSAVEVLDELAARGLRLTLEGEGLLVAPKSKVTEADRELIRVHRPALLEHLRGGETPAQRCERLDGERASRDGIAHRGYDYDHRAAEHRAYLARMGTDCVCLHRTKICQLDIAVACGACRICLLGEVIQCASCGHYLCGDCVKHHINRCGEVGHVGG